MEKLATKVGVSKQDDWYTVTTNQVKKHGGAGLLSHYKGSLRQGMAVKECF
jgi:hypothetical protein